MTAEELALNIAVNLGRIGRFAMEGKEVRLKQFLLETEEYIQLLDTAQKNEQFMKTWDAFRNQFNRTLKKTEHVDDAWAETAFTWANILTHRAKLA